MGRNDLCFCGSGKKQKYCHYNIYERSIIAETLILYNGLDKKLCNLTTRTCKKGCSECCSQFFSISEIEFAIIIDYLVCKFGKEKTNQIINKGIMLNNEFSKKHPDYFNSLEKNVTGYSKMEYFKTTFKGLPNLQGFPCVFLDEFNTCLVYDVRPLICRTHGTTYFSDDEPHEICSNIKNSELNKINMVCIDEYKKNIQNMTIYKDNKSNKALIRRPYPIFYFIKLYFESYSIEDYYKLPTIYHLFNSSRTNFIDYLSKTYN